jgi:hypothetical protein
VPITSRLGRVRFDDAAKDLITDYRVDHLLGPWFNGRRLSSITTPDIREYIKHRLEQGAAHVSINLELANLKRIYTLARQAGTALYRPHIPMLKEDNVRTGFFERAQFEGAARASGDAGLLHRLARAE